MKSHQSGWRRLVHIAATLFSAPPPTPASTFISELFFSVNGIFWGPSTQPSVIIPHLTTSVALLLSALMQRRFRGRQYKILGYQRMWHRELMLQIICKATPPPLLRRSLIISQSMLLCSSLQVCLLLLIFYSFLFLSSRQICESRLKASHGGQAGESRPRGDVATPTDLHPSKKKKKKVKKEVTIRN